jgi:hypothetical protein
LDFSEKAEFIVRCNIKEVKGVIRLWLKQFSAGVPLAGIINFDFFPGDAPPETPLRRELALWVPSSSKAHHDSP